MSDAAFSESEFARLKQESYDDLRRQILGNETFDGPQGVKAISGGKALSIPSNVNAKNIARSDAVFEAVRDLVAEGLVRIENGEIHVEPRPRPSDRSKDDRHDHKHHSAEAFDGSPAVVDHADLPAALRSFVDVADFGPTLLYYGRTVRVGGHVWAYTYSAMKASDAVLESLKAYASVFSALARGGSAPMTRSESFIVRFPYASERQMLDIAAHLSRLPIIVAEGSVYADCDKKVLVEKYVNFMRSDRYIIASDMPVHV